MTNTGRNPKVRPESVRVWPCGSTTDCRLLLQLCPYIPLAIFFSYAHLRLGRLEMVLHRRLPLRPRQPTTWLQKASTEPTTWSLTARQSCSLCLDSWQMELCGSRRSIRFHSAAPVLQTGKNLMIRPPSRPESNGNVNHITRSVSSEFDTHPSSLPEIETRAGYHLITNSLEDHAYHIPNYTDTRVGNGPLASPKPIPPLL